MRKLLDFLKLAWPAPTAAPRAPGPKPRELMTDSDRVLPGEGDFHLTAVVARLKEIGYAGAVSVEVMNPVLWKAKPSQVGELALASVQRLLG